MLARRRDRQFRRAGAAALLVAQLAACYQWKPVDTGVSSVMNRATPPDEIRLILRGGERMMLRSPRLAGDSLVGAVPIMVRGRQDTERRAVPTDSIVEVAVHRFDGLRTAGVIAGAGLTVALIAAIASGDDADEPAPCSGDNCVVSCPLVYSWTEGGWRLDSGTFGGAIARALSRTDVDNLELLQADGDSIRVLVRNELSETDHIDALEIVAVDHPIGSLVVPDGRGRIHGVGLARPPVRAVDRSGRTVLDRVARDDGWSWESSLETRDPDDRAGRDAIELTFARPAGASRARLLVDGRNTPWSAYLMVAFIAARGRTAQAWYDSLEADPRMAAGLRATLAREAFLSVKVATPAGWVDAGYVHEAGPEITKRQVHELDLSGAVGDTVRIRLEAPPSFWMIDRVAIDYGPDPSLTSYPLRLARATARIGGGAPTDVRALVSAPDGTHLTLETGEHAEVVFVAPPAPPAGTRSFLLKSTGWYRIHADEAAEPQTELLAGLGGEYAMSREATRRRNRATDALSRGLR